MTWSLQPRAIATDGTESDGYTHLVLKADSESNAANERTQVVVVAGTAAPATGSGSGTIRSSAVGAVHLVLVAV